MKTFPGSLSELDYTTAEELRNCMKKPILVSAMQINEEFRVTTLEGNYKQGKPGDYLMCGIDNELYICNEGIFKRVYDFK